MERPSDDDGLRMLALVTLAKQHDFDLRRLPRTRAVLIEDLAFNAMLIAANRALEHIATELGEDLPVELVERFRSTERALDTLWDEATGQYFSRNAVTGELIRVPTIATFLPLWSGTLPAARGDATDRAPARRRRSTGRRSRCRACRSTPRSSRRRATGRARRG